MLQSFYIQGYNSALSDLLIKEAGPKNWFKNLAVAGAVTGGAVGGGYKGSVAGMRYGVQKGTEEYQAVMRTRADKLVDTQSFLRKIRGVKAEAITAEEQALSVLEQMKLQGEIPRNSNTKQFAKDWMKSPEYKSINEGFSGRFTPGQGAVLGERADPNIILHEALGHGSQEAEFGTGAMWRKINESNTLPGVLKGKKVDLEQDAWQRVLDSGHQVDPEVLNASLGAYRTERAGAIGGGVAGAGAGAGGTGVGLLGLSSLLASLKKGAKKAPKRKS